MSAINNALSQLAKDNAPLNSDLRLAQVPAVKQHSILAWVIGSFCLSLAVGGWAISQPTPSQSSSVEQDLSKQAAFKQQLLKAQRLKQSVVALKNAQFTSPTSQVIELESRLYQAEVSKDVPPNAVATTERQPTAKRIKKTVKNVKTVKSVKGVKANHTSAANHFVTKNVHRGEVVVEQVELTPKQLAEKAQVRATKALESNNLTDALQHYQESLRYDPRDKQVRKRLAALYYGKGEVRKAANLLQKGITLDKNDTILRLALTKILLKEQQNSAALTVLTALPSAASVDYLSLRAALAQKQKQNQLALQSYQQLVQREPQSGRWWMGLAIQQERELQLTEAKYSYIQALSRLGLSSQSQQFIHDRLTLIERLEEQPSEN